MNENELKEWLKNNLVLDFYYDNGYLNLKIGFKGDNYDWIGSQNKQKWFIERSARVNYD